MSNIVCNIVDAQILDLAAKLGKTPAFTCNLVSTWQTVNSSVEHPQIEELRGFLQSLRPSTTKGMFIDQNNDYARLSRDFNPNIRHDRAILIANLFTNIINNGVEEKIAEFEEALSQTEDREEKRVLLEKIAKLGGTNGRHEVIKEITLKSIFDKIRGELESYLDYSEAELDAAFGQGKGAYMHQEYQKILNNFPALLDEACSIIEGKESVRFTVEYKRQDSNITLDGDIVDQTEEENDDNEDGASGNDGWSYQVRFVDPHSSLSKDVKRVISGLVKETADGSIDTDDLGNVRYINEEYAHTVLLNELSTMVDADDFNVRDAEGNLTFPALEKMTTKYPWVNQIILVLAADERLAGSFFADLRKDFIPYWHQYVNEEGVLVTHPLNENTAKESTLTQITNNYEGKNLLSENSLYGKDGKINKANTDTGLSLCSKAINLLRDLDEEDYPELTNTVSEIMKMLGLDSNPLMISNLLQTTDGFNSVEASINAALRIFEGSKTVDEDAHLIKQFDEDFNIIAENLGVVNELDNIASFRQGDKTRYSYSAPNYIDSMIKNIKSDSRRAQYMQEEFGRYKWFKHNGKWRSEWLRLLEENEDVRHQFQTKELIDIKGVEYSGWTPTVIREAFINEYFSHGINNKATTQFAWYNMPIFSDSPVVKFIRCVRYTGDYKSKLIPLFNKVVKQELYRIDVVNSRKEAIKQDKAKAIQNFDAKGDKFCFFPELNRGTFLAEALQLRADKNMEELDSLINSNIEVIMNNLFAEFMNNSSNQLSSIADNLVKQGVITDTESAPAAIEEYFWNQAYASTQIIEMTTTDLAYYKDDVDFQKRYKEVYAAGTKLNTNTTYGKQYRSAIYVADQIVTSRNFIDLKQTLDQAVANGQIQSFDRDNILNKFKDINVADAQAYLTPQSMRSVLDMMGAWADQMEESLQRFENGSWDMADFNTLWQTIKPFVYTQLPKADEVSGDLMRVPHQNKNSEFLLLAAYETIATSLNKSPKLKALQKFMKENDIDVIQFESAVKAGGQGIININYSKKALAEELNDQILEAAKESLSGTVKPEELDEKFAKLSNIKKFKLGNDLLLEKGIISQSEYNSRFDRIEPSEQEVYDTLSVEAKTKDGSFNPNVVHQIPYRDYVIQQPTPEHLLDTTAVFGSQLRNLIMADLPANFSLTLNGKTLNRQEVIDLYNSIIVENLLEDFAKVEKRFSNIKELQAELLRQVKSNVKFSRDMVNALQIREIINPLTGLKEKVFNIPFSNPLTADKLQELVTSMFKNAVTKQHIKGGNAILVSNYGLTKELNLVYEGKGEKKRVVGVQCYLPAYSKQFYEPFLVEKNGHQELDISKMPEELRELVGYRIPTEDKYSMAPLIVMGFLPQQNGSSIMLPEEITSIAGSDFDIDKMFLMIPEFRTLKYNMKKARADYEAISNDDATNALLKAIFQDKEDIEEILEDSPEDFKKWFDENKEKYTYKTPIVRKVTYDMTKEAKDNKRNQRNNMLIDIIRGVLTHESTASKFLNPGNFDKAKLQARITQIVTNEPIYRAFCESYNLTTRKEAISKILSMSKEGKLDELNDFLKKYKEKNNTQRSQLTLDTFIYNHTQNMTGGALIGVYANNTTMQAKYQHSRLTLKDEFSFFVNGREVKSLHDAYSPLGERISANCAQFSAASVDNVKDPVLADLLQNMDTARVTGFMLRAGMSVEEISLLFGQPLVRQCITETGSLKKLGEYIKGAISSLQQQGGGFDANYRAHNFSSEELLNNIVAEYDAESISNEERLKVLASQIQALKLMEHIVKCASDLAELTGVSRADSPNGAIHHTLAGAKVQVSKVSALMSKSKSRNYSIAGLEESMQNNLITTSMTTDEKRAVLLKRQMPMLQAFYSLGIELATDIIGKQFPQFNQYSDTMLNEVLDNAPTTFITSKQAPKLVRDFYNDIINFVLSRTTLFGNDESMTFEQKRDYYLNRFPIEFMAIKAANPKIANVGLMRKMTVDNNVIKFAKSGRLSQIARDSFMRDMESLMYIGDTGEQLVYDLFMYSYYKEGFKFGPNSFGNFFNTNVLNSFPEFITALNTLKSSMGESFFSEFLSQYYANRASSGIVPSLSNKDAKELLTSEDGYKLVPSGISFNRTTRNGDYKRLFIDEVLYELVAKSNQSVPAVYQPVTTFKTQIVKYNANMTAEEMTAYEDTEIAKEAKNAEKTKNNPPEDLFISDFDYSVLDSLDSGSELNSTIDSSNLDNALAQLEGSSLADDYLANIPETPNQETANTSNSSQETSRDFSSYEFQSGAAQGSDKFWESLANKNGIKMRNYTVQYWDEVLNNQQRARLEAEYQDVVQKLGRTPLPMDSFSGKLVRRDMVQADKADAIFAIGHVGDNGLVDGGTGYATTRGIILQKPVYVFDQQRNTWMSFNYNTRRFEPCSEPTLTPKAALIGTRQLQDNGKRAAESIMNKLVSTTQMSAPNIDITTKQGMAIQQELASRYTEEGGNDSLEEPMCK